LLEAVVMAHHGAGAILSLIADGARPPARLAAPRRSRRPLREAARVAHNWENVRRLMWDMVGIVRTDERLGTADERLRRLRVEIEHDFAGFRLTPDLVELRNLALVAQLIVRSALWRRESRGLHYNLDHPRR